MIDEQQIDIIITGLKGLYEKLAIKEKRSGQEESKESSMWFDSEKDKCLESLKELFLYRQNANREKRIKMNENTKALRSVSRVFWVTRIMIFLDLDECLKLNQVCVYFNHLIRSPLFVKFMVQINEHTKIDISLNTFETQEHKIMNQTKKGVAQMMGHQQPGAPKHVRGEDRDARIEMLQNTKKYLTEQVRQSQEEIKTLQKDIETIKELARIEKQTKQKAQALLSQKEKELEDLRREYLQKEQDNRSKINELLSQNAEKERQADNLVAERKKLKLHKKVLKEEVMRLRQQLTESEKKVHSKQAALKNLGEFFNNQTMNKIRQIKSDAQDQNE